VGIAVFSNVVKEFVKLVLEANGNIWKIQNLELL
jgi:hypothetical protein